MTSEGMGWYGMVCSRGEFNSVLRHAQNNDHNRQLADSFSATQSQEEVAKNLAKAADIFDQVNDYYHQVVEEKDSLQKDYNEQCKALHICHDEAAKIHQRIEDLDKDKKCVDSLRKIPEEAQNSEGIIGCYNYTAILHKSHLQLIIAVSSTEAEF